jgi:hypothetical protein
MEEQSIRTLVETCATEFTTIGFQTATEMHLAKQLGDPEVARRLAAVIGRVLDWDAPRIHVERIRSVIAFSFGMRRESNGNVLPGPVNQTLAAFTEDVFELTNCNVYAQHEIVSCFGNRIPSDRVMRIDPILDPVDGTLIYLSSLDVLKKVIDLAAGRELGEILIVAQRHHGPRVCRLANEMNLDAYLPEDRELPLEFDPESSQPWVRDCFLFALHTALSLMTVERRSLTGTQSPHMR